MKIRLTLALVAGFATVSFAAPYTEGAAGAAFSSIAGGSSILLPNISACDDCIDSRTLPRAFNWFADTAVTMINVTSNGDINIGSSGPGAPGAPSTNQNCCTSDPVIVGGAVTYARIAINSGDLCPGCAGDVWFRDTGSSYIISFENSAFCCSATPVASAQCEMFDNGNVEIRYGGGTLAGGRQIACGLEEDSRAMAHPCTTITGFDSQGISNGPWPTSGMGVRFTVAGGGGGGGGGPVPSASTWSLVITALLLVTAVAGRLARS